MATTVVLVTGCSDGGIGAALVQTFRKRGCRVFASARSIEAMSALAGLSNVERIKLDVTDHAAVHVAVDAIVQTAGRLDIVVNNAGYGLFGPIIESDMAAVKKQFETNVFGALAVCQAAAPHMIRQRSGKIVNIGSISGILSTPFSGAYSATKAALHALSDSMRIELAPFGVDVVVVAPGAIKSEFSNKVQQSVSEEKLVTDSFYTGARDALERRKNSSQQGATPTAEFAEATVAAVLRQSPPAYFFYGRHSFLMPFLKRWLPPFVTDWIALRVFGLLGFVAIARSTDWSKVKKA